MIGNRYEYDAMAACEQEMWWYRCLHDLTFQHIQKKQHLSSPRILDAGCGTGGLLVYLKEKGFTNLNGFDLSPDAVEYARTSTGIDVQLVDITRADEAYPENYFDIITSHDTVCLLQQGQDTIALSKLLAILKPGGVLLMNLPALKAFNGTHDIAVGIQKRYSIKAIKNMIGQRALIKSYSYWPFLLSPGIFFTRSIQKISTVFRPRKKVVSDVKMPSSMVNRFFYTLTNMENTHFRVKPWGSSLFLMLQKNI
ncbi:MAG: class I SAM-dependent methyltransferase [Chitinophagaceae bacterium]